MCVAPNTRISADMQCASTYGYYPCGDWKNVVSTNATDDFTVEISVSTGMLRMGNVHIGFTTRAAFLANAFMLQSPGVYTLWPLCGVLYGKRVLWQVRRQTRSSGRNRLADSVCF